MNIILRTGANSHVEGKRNTVSGNSAHGEGIDNAAVGEASHVGGSKVMARGGSSFAHGQSSNKAEDAVAKYNEKNGTAYDYKTFTDAQARAIQTYKYTGDDGKEATTAFLMSKGGATTAVGINTLATTEGAFATGNLTYAKGATSFAEGTNTEALATNAHASGDSTKASGINAFTMGSGTIASGKNTFTGGTNAVASGENAFAYGLGTTNNTNTITSASGDIAKIKEWEKNPCLFAAVGATTVFGIDTLALSRGAFAMGERTIAQQRYTLAQGYKTRAYASSSVALGEGTIAGGASANGNGTINNLVLIDNLKKVSLMFENIDLIKVMNSCL